jgi:hypothetical protein
MATAMAALTISAISASPLLSISSVWAYTKAKTNAPYKNIVGFPIVAMLPNK